MAQQTTRTKQTQTRKTKWPWVLAIGTALLVLGASAYFLLNGGVMNEQAKMEQYLEEKYNKEFVVEKPERKASGLGVEGYLEATAYPEDDQSLTFKVRDSSTSTSDEYTGAVWEKEERKRLEPIVEDIFSKDVTLELEIRTTGTARGDINIHGEVPSFELGEQKYNKNILYILRIETQAPIDENNTTQVSEKIYVFLQNLNVKTDIIFSYSTDIGNNKKYGVALDEAEIKGISGPEALTPFYKEWRAA
jgi:hypothetical protein